MPGIKDIRYFAQAKACRASGRAPLAILFPVAWVTNRCNLQCKMCDQWKTPPDILAQELATKEWIGFVDSCARLHAAVVVITGGEPLLRSDIFEIIRRIRDRRMSSHLCSNGTLLDEKTVRALGESGLDSVSVSLDSYLPEVHNWMRGRDCFEAAVRGIGLLRKIAPRIRVGVNYVICKKNFQNLDRMLAFAEKLGVHQIKFDPVHTNLMHRKKPLVTFRELLFEPEDMPLLRAEVAKLMNAARHSQVLTNSRTFIRGIPALYLRDRHPALACYAGYISCAVDACGGVAPCDNFDPQETIREKPLEEIWRSASFEKMREAVVRCNCCCWDTTHAELNIRCRPAGLLKEFGQVFKEILFYLK